MKKEELKVLRFGQLIDTIKANAKVGELIHFMGEMFRVCHDSARGLFIDIEDHQVLGGSHEVPKRSI